PLRDGVTPTTLRAIFTSSHVRAAAPSAPNTSPPAHAAPGSKRPSCRRPKSPPTAKVVAASAVQPNRLITPGPQRPWATCTIGPASPTGTKQPMPRSVDELPEL